MKRLAFVCLLAMAPLPALAATASGAASADVISPIAVRKIRDLDFGVIAANGGSAGSVTIAPGGSAAHYNGGAQEACSSNAHCPAPHFAQFEVSGEANRAYTIVAPARVTVAGEPTGDSLATTTVPPLLMIDDIRIRSASRPDAGRAGWLDSAGRDSFDLGGTLRVPAATPPAHFRVSVEVIVTYS